MAIASTRRWSPPGNVTGQEPWTPTPHVGAGEGCRGGRAIRLPMHLLDFLHPSGSGSKGTRLTREGSDPRPAQRGHSCRRPHQARAGCEKVAASVKLRAAQGELGLPPVWPTPIPDPFPRSREGPGLGYPGCRGILNFRKRLSLSAGPSAVLFIWCLHSAWHRGTKTSVDEPMDERANDTS